MGIFDIFDIIVCVFWLVVVVVLIVQAVGMVRDWIRRRLR